MKDDEHKDYPIDDPRSYDNENDTTDITEGDTTEDMNGTDDTMTAQGIDYRPADGSDGSTVYHLSGMYRNWFLDYASYVILERAVPHINDGLKPVQRRILHTMKKMDDGRYNKVANVVGTTMQYHPHGDASIGDALVQLGQKELLIDTQGNWGNILTGSPAAAPRYIEARLSKFALDVVFNPKTTEWKMSYDGRNREPITLPVKYPLLLAQGAEGIAVGLSSKILPHNFVEICNAAISYLQGKPFGLYPDFPAGGSIDVSRYNDGRRGGLVKVRAKIDKLDQKTLVIREIPFTKNSETLIDSITKAVEKGKIKARKVEDLTASNVEILVHLTPGISSDKTIDALYAFTDCEVSISPNCCVIEDNKPLFLSVSDVLRHSTDQTLDLLRKELEIRKGELLEQLHFASLEKIFIEERIYKGKPFEEAGSIDEACAYIDKRLTPFYPDMIRGVTKDDLLRLMEIKMQRILRFSKDKAEELMAHIREELEDINRDLADMVSVTIRWFEFLKKKYGADHPRLTEIKSFDTIEAVKVVEANEKLYINRQEGFIGTSLRKDEFVCNCSDIDDIIIFYRDGKYKVVRVADKIFVGKNVMHLQVFKKNDKRTIYNVVYRDGKEGISYIKRFYVATLMRDREYDLGQGTPGTKILYFTANPNGEAEVIKVQLRPAPKLKKASFDYDFAQLAVKGRAARGNLLTKYAIKVVFKHDDGVSTLTARDLWYDDTVRRLNADKRGQYLGAFEGDDRILQLFSNGEFKVTGYDLSTHFDDDMVEIRKFDPDDIFSVIYIEGETQKMYLKRFCIDRDVKMNTRCSFIGEHEAARYLSSCTDVMPRLLLSYQVSDAGNSFPDDEVNVEEFIGIKSYKAKGKRLSNREIERFEWLEPYEPEVTEVAEEPEGEDPVEKEEGSEITTQEVPTPETLNQELTTPDPFDDDKKHGGEPIQMELF